MRPDQVPDHIRVWGSQVAHPEPGSQLGDHSRKRAAQGLDVGGAVGRDRFEGEGDADVPVGEGAHRGEDVARLQPARRARRARCNDDAQAVEGVDDALAVDIEGAERHDMGESLDRVTDDVDLSDSGRGGTDLVDEGPGRGRLGGACVNGLLPGLRGSERHRDPGVGGFAAVLGFPPRPGEVEAGARPHDQDTERGPGHRGGVTDEDVIAARGVQPSERRRAIDEKRKASVTAYRKKVLEGLDGADLAVGVLERDRSHRWTVSNGEPQRLGGETSPEVDGEGSAVGVGLVRLAQKNGLVDGGREHPGADTSTSVAQSGDPGAESMNSTGVEGDFVGAGTHRSSDALSRAVEKMSSLTTLPVKASRVGPARVEGREEGLAGGGMQRAAVGVQHACTVTPPVPEKFRVMHYCLYVFQQTTQEGATVPQHDHLTPRSRGLRMAIWAAVAVIAMATLSGCELGAAKDGFLPRGVTENAVRVRELWIGAWIALLVVGALVWGLILWCVVAYRRRRDDNELPVQLRYNVPLEILYTILPIFMIAVFFFYTARDQSALLDTKQTPDVTVNVVGKQWSWDFNYIEDNVHEVGTQAIMTGEPGAEETIPTMYLPVNERTEFVLTSRDVIHSFWVPQFLQKLDIIPGKVNKFQVVPTEEGTFKGKCAELCGAYHSHMLFNVKIVSRADFDAHVADLKSRGQTGLLGTDLNRGGSGLVPGEDQLLPKELRN